MAVVAAAALVELPGLVVPAAAALVELPELAVEVAEGALLLTDDLAEEFWARDRSSPYAEAAEDAPLQLSRLAPVGLVHSEAPFESTVDVLCVSTLGFAAVVAEEHRETEAVAAAAVQRPANVRPRRRDNNPRTPGRCIRSRLSPVFAPLQSETLRG